jgi:hypothetical protein
MNLGSGSGGTGKDDLDSMMKKLGLREEDLDDVVFEDQPPPPVEVTRWLAIARVHTEREFSDFWFFKNMRMAWDLAQDVKFRSLENNLFTMQFSCLGDWDKVMEGGPWTFRGHPVLLADYDGFTKPSEIALNTFKIWIQIHDLPDGYKPMIETLAAKVGKVIGGEPTSGDFSGNFFRVRVWLDVRVPLKIVVSMIRGGKRQLFLVKYERLPDWCAVCGMIGHLYTEHGDGIHKPETLVFKDLKANWSIRTPGRGRGRGRGPGRGQGRGNLGEFFSEEHLSSQYDDAGLGEEEDPMTLDPNRKRLIHGQETEGSGITVNDLVNQFQLPNPKDKDPLSSPPKRDPKRMRSGANEVVNGNDMATDDNLNLAGSSERRPVQ